MLDFRIFTFLELYRTKNYTKTAENLHMTQPAVTQHIKFLEEYYHCKLVNYDKKNLTITQQGEILYKSLLTISCDFTKLKQELEEKKFGERKLNFGATLIISEHIMPKIIAKISKDFPELTISFITRDTKELLEDLDLGKIDFALVEGFFEKTEYESFLLAKENFIGICSKNNKLAKSQLHFNDILEERILLREIGSGTRDIFEKILYDNNLSINDFSKKYEIENVKVIKKLVEENVGISFLYEKAVEKELEEKKLDIINLESFKEEREFNFVFLKNSLYSKEYYKWYKYIMKLLDK